MGREIRKVPPNWKHPEKDEYSPYNRMTEKRFQPLYDQNCEAAVKEWNEGIVLWNQEKHSQQIEHKARIESGDLYEPDPKREDSLESCKRLNDPDYYLPSNGYNYWDYFGNPPDPEYYRTYKDEDATWFQLYETVSEGTPVTPPFETKEELADYLAENGDFWDQKRRKDPNRTGGMDCKPWGKEQAYKFVMGNGWAPSFVMTGGKFKSGVEAVTES